MSKQTHLFGSTGDEPPKLPAKPDPVPTADAMPPAAADTSPPAEAEASPVAAPEAPPAAGALSVTAFNERVSGFLRGLFPGSFRIQGYVSGFQRSWRKGGHVYFDLLDKDEDDASRILSQASLVIWRGKRERLRRDLVELAGSVEPGAVFGAATRAASNAANTAGPDDIQLDDQQVTFEVSVNYYIPRGRLSLIVEGIDLAASLGAQKLDRERVLRRLAADGLLDRNRGRPLAAVPLRLALITSLESAAYHDFVKELDLSGLAFRLGVIDARVQGAEQEDDMRAAFATVTRRAADYDAVVLIRGGGSRGDLAGFDSELLARAIAHCPLPVLAGIGHEIDRSVADEVAHRSLKTPTAVAQFLVQRVTDWQERLESQAETLRRVAQRRLQVEGARLERRAQTLRATLGRALVKGRDRLGERQARLPLLAGQALRLGRIRVEHLRGRLGPRLAGRLLTETRRLEQREQGLRLLDPQAVLSRGFSLSRDAAGRLLRDSAGLEPGDIIHTRLAEGEIESEVRRLSGQADGADSKGEQS